MLSPSTVQDIIECRLPEEKTLEFLESLTTDKLDVDTVRMFIDVLRETLDQPSRDLHSYIGANDPSGTGGSGLPHFNASTTVAFILAAGDMKVAKFGNRGAQSRCGSFDLLEALGVPFHTPPQAVPELLQETGLAFLYAPQYYPGLAKLAPIRKKLAKRTVFNILGPLLNPIRPDYRVMGIACADAQKVVADYLSQEKSNRRSLIVRSQSGLDELEPYGNNVVFDSMQGYVYRTEINGLPSLDSSKLDRSKIDRSGNGNVVFSPGDACVAPTTGALSQSGPARLHSETGGQCASVRFDSEADTGGKSASTRLDSETARAQVQKTFSFTPEENYKLFLETVRGEGPQFITDMVCLNAAAGFVANCCSSIEACFDLAYDLIKSGAVAAKVEQCRRSYAKFASR